MSKTTLTIMIRGDLSPGFKAKPNAHSMRAHESSLYTYHTENGYRITNVNIYYLILNNVLQKTKANTLEDMTVERHHNFISNRPGVIARIELLIEVLQFFFIFRAAGGEG
jgi:hypothetical protein